jgi:DNA polymerase I-like protein with 3'-5' exonuclease and polymerase domains
VDVEAATQLNDEWKRKEEKLLKAFPFDIWSGGQIARYCDSKGINYPRTGKGNPSITKEVMQSTPALADLVRVRDLNRLRKVYVEDGILQLNTRGRIHAQFLQTAREEGGTRSGRFAMRAPNLQQIPSRHAEAYRIRNLYIAEDGCQWAKCDYNSQEPRLQIHYGLLKEYEGSTQAKEIFANGGKLYNLIQDATGVSYKDSKTILLGISYGMGKNKLSDFLGITLENTEKVLDDLNKALPFLSMINRDVKAKAGARGYIKTLLGRKARFNWWMPRNEYGAKPVKGFEAATRAYPSTTLTRAFTQKALNRLIQGGSADQAKKAMVDMKKAGLIPCLPVHDEINRSNCLNEKEANLQKEIMEQTIQLRIPSVVDLDLGRSWC